MRNIVCSNNGKIPETIFIAFGCGKLKIEKNYYSFSKITDTVKLGCKMFPPYACVHIQQLLNIDGLAKRQNILSLCDIKATTKHTMYR